MGFRPKNLPLVIVEQNGPRSNQLLEGPASFKPCTATERKPRDVWVFVERDNVVEPGQTDFSFRIPLEHRVQGFLELHAVGLVDAAGIDPQVVQLEHGAER